MGIVVVEMFLVAEKEDFCCSRFKPSLIFISKVHGLKIHDITSIGNNSNYAQTLLKQQLEKILTVRYKLWTGRKERKRMDVAKLLQCNRKSMAT